MTDTQDRRPPMTPDEAARALGLDKVSLDPRRAVLRMCRKGDLRRIRVLNFAELYT